MICPECWARPHRLVCPGVAAASWPSALAPTFSPEVGTLGATWPLRLVMEGKDWSTAFGFLGGRMGIEKFNRALHVLCTTPPTPAWAPVLKAEEHRPKRTSRLLRRVAATAARAMKMQPEDRFALGSWQDGPTNSGEGVGRRAAGCMPFLYATEQLETQVVVKQAVADAVPKAVLGSVLAEDRLPPSPGVGAAWTQLIRQGFFEEQGKVPAAYSLEACGGFCVKAPDWHGLCTITCQVCNRRPCSMQLPHGPTWHRCPECRPQRPPPKPPPPGVGEAAFSVEDGAQMETVLSESESGTIQLDKVLWVLPMDKKAKLHRKDDEVSRKPACCGSMRSWTRTATQGLQAPLPGRRLVQEMRARREDGGRRHGLRLRRRQ